MNEELDKIKNKLLHDFIKVLKERDPGKFDEVFSYDDIYKIITSLHYKQ